MNLTFSNPEFLWLLLSIPLLVAAHFFVARNLKTSAWRFANYEAIVRITGGKPTLQNATKLSRNIILLTIKCVVLLFLVLAVAGTTLRYSGKGSSSDFVVAIDASSSMLAQDFEPNRLEAAKNAGKLFIDSLSPDSSVGVVSFAGTSFVELEPTRDRIMAKQKIDEIKIKSSGGTDLGEAMITSSNLLVSRGSQQRASTVVLLTDGRSTVGTKVEDGISYAKERSVAIDTVGVATLQGGNFTNIDLISTIDEQSLQDIADQTGGKYYRAENTDKLKTAFSSIANSDKVQIPIDLKMPLLMLGLALIFVEWGLAATKFRTLP